MTELTDASTDSNSLNSSEKLGKLGSSPAGTGVANWASPELFLSGDANDGEEK